MREDIPSDRFLADIRLLEDELKKHSAKLTEHIAILNKKKIKLEANLAFAKKDHNSSQIDIISNELNLNIEDRVFYEKSQEFIELQTRLIHAMGVNFTSDYLIGPKVAATNALEKLAEFETILEDYIKSAVSKEIIGSAVVLLESSKKIRTQYEKYGVKYEHMKVGAERGQRVEPVLHLKKADIKFMTFSGGGAKGTAYGGVLVALDENGILPGIEAVAGSSAGSMMAAFIAAGVSVSDTLSLLQGLTKEVIDKSLEEYVREGLRKSIINYIYHESCKPNKFTGNLDMLIQANPNIPSKTLETLLEIYAFVTTGSPVTFGHIDKLHEIDPIRFKHLHITASNIDQNTLKIFSSENSEDANVSIAQACLASSALPVVRSVVTINGKRYRDGGVLNNNPRECFPPGKGRTLAFYFPSESHEQALKGQEDYSGERGMMWKLEKLATKSKVTGFKRSGKLHELAVEKEFYDILNNPFETIVVDTGTVGTVDFKKGTKLMEYLLIKGEMQTQRYLNNVVSDAMHDHTLEFRSVMLKAFEISMKKTELPEVRFHIKPVTFKSPVEKMHPFKSPVEKMHPFKSPVEKMHLLDFCKKPIWEHAFATNISGDIKEVVFAAMKDCFQVLKIDKQLKLAKVLAEALNDTECSPKVKEAFIRGLNLTQTQDMSKLSDEPMSPSSKVAKHRISAEDFRSFITDLNRESAHIR